MWSWFLKELRTTKLVQQKCALSHTEKYVLIRRVGSERRHAEDTDALGAALQCELVFRGLFYIPSTGV